jgi:DNA-binding CsgD family transcriptional regulator/tetratricopeptide (TPR) repeat protein
MPRWELPTSDEWFVGRVSELAAIRACVDAVSAGPGGPGQAGRAVWVEGDPGSGKTALVNHLVAELPAAFVVLRAAADESTADQPFAVLEQLGVEGGESPQAAGLDLVALLTEAGGGGPVAVVVEDLHWADRESRQALLTVARRVGEERVLLLVTSRPDAAPDAAPDGWERLFLDPSGRLRVVLGALGRDDVAEMARVAGMALPARAVERLHEHSGGLALYVRTLLAEISASQLAAPGGELPVPRSLASTILARLAELPPDARELAAALSVVGEAVPLPVAGRIARVDHPVKALEALLGTGFVTWWPGEASTPAGFAHPLYRAALYADLAPTRRRELHRAAAESLDAASALRHRVAAADGIDDDLARDLDESAAERASKGARSLAATYLLWASSLGSGPQLNERRVLRAARLLLEDGQTARAAELRERVERCGEGPLRSLVLGQLAWEEAASIPAESWLIEALKPAGGPEPDGEVAAAALGHLATMYYTQSRGQEAIDAATRLLTNLTNLTDLSDLSDLSKLSNLTGELERSGWIALAAGTAADQGAAAGLDCLAGRLPQPAESVPAADADLLIVRGALGFYAGRTTAAIADLRAAIRLARHGAAAAQLPRAHLQLSQLLLSSGEWDEAFVHARAALSLVSAERRVWMDAQVHAALARLFGGRGEWPRAGEHLAAADAAAGEAGTIEAVVTTRVARAAVARARDDPGQVVTILAPLVENPHLIPMSTSLAWWPSLIGAMIDGGELAEAPGQIELLDAAARQRGLNMQARIAGARAQLEAAQGRPDQACSSYSRAIALLGPDDPLLDRAELHHRFGRLLAARGGKRRQAVDQLRVARDLFAAAGAEPFLHRAEADLAPLGITVGRPGSRSPLELTDRERDVAVLVAKGMTNREVAAELYVSPKAIDYHLGHIFGKLGITSRRDLRQQVLN